MVRHAARTDGIYDTPSVKTKAQLLRRVPLSVLHHQLPARVAKVRGIRRHDERDRQQLVVASLLPINATFPGSIGGGATPVVDSYPFGESATIKSRYRRDTDDDAHPHPWMGERRNDR